MSEPSQESSMPAIASDVGGGNELADRGFLLEHAQYMSSTDDISAGTNLSEGNSLHTVRPNGPALPAKPPKAHTKVDRKNSASGPQRSKYRNKNVISNSAVLPDIVNEVLTDAPHANTAPLLEANVKRDSFQSSQKEQADHSTLRLTNCLKLSC